MLSRTRSALFVVIVVFAGILAGACEVSKNPAGNTPVVPEPPVVAPGTSILTIPISGSETPMRYWLVATNPKVGEKLTVGIATVSTKCTIPTTHRAYVMMRWVKEGEPNTGYNGGGMGTICDEWDNTSGLEVNANTPNVVALELSFWFWPRLSSEPRFPEGPPNVVDKITLNWRSPSSQ